MNLEFYFKPTAIEMVTLRASASFTIGRDPMRRFCLH